MPVECATRLSLEDVTPIEISELAVFKPIAAKTKRVPRVQWEALLVANRDWRSLTYGDLPMVVNVNTQT